MCGICGFVGLDDKKLLLEMCSLLEHRGPDDQGIYVGDSVGLGNRRLSIIDLEGGRQPIPNEEESMWVVLNGEIYNYRELTRKLEGKGHRFKTESDTEVIVHAYEEYGIDFLKQIDGMFGLAIWDSVNHRLVLARDQLGVKPLYYSVKDGVLLFASEIKSILRYGRIKPEVDVKGLRLFLNLRYLPYELTMFEGVKKVLAGQALIWEDNNLSSKGYWEMPTEKTDDNESAIVKKVRANIEQAVERQMVADVELGAFLSGGLDTSTLVALMSKYSEKPVKTFCMGFGEETDENKDASIVSQMYETEHYDLIIDSKQDLKLMPQAVWHLDAPKINLYPYHVSQLASKHVKVCLSGLGGDELFAGYVPRFNYVNYADKIAKNVPRFVRYLPMEFAKKLAGWQARHGPLSLNHLRNMLRAFSQLDDGAGFYTSFRSLHMQEQSILYKGMRAEPNEVKQIFSRYFNGRPLLDSVLLAEMKTVLVDDYLVVDDGMSMAHSLEVRVPFLDRQLVENSIPIPSNLKVKGGEGKYILKRAVCDLLPDEIVKKKKQGFAMDIGTWFRGELREVAAQVLDESEALKKFFHLEYPKKILEHEYSPQIRRGYYLLWTLVAFDIWHRIYMDGDCQKPKRRFW